LRNLQFLKKVHFKNAKIGKKMQKRKEKPKKEKGNRAGPTSNLGGMVRDNGRPG
jgi:hypothetical protein